jgi:hypothetical protein
MRGATEQAAKTTPPVDDNVYGCYAPCDEAPAPRAARLTALADDPVLSTRVAGKVKGMAPEPFGRNRPTRPRRIAVETHDRDLICYNRNPMP